MTSSQLRRLLRVSTRQVIEYNTNSVSVCAYKTNTRKRRWLF